MKRIITMICTIPMLFSLSSCADSAGTQTKQDTDTNIESQIIDTSSSENDETDTQTTPPNTNDENDLKIEIVVGNKVFSATLYDNEAAKALISHLPMTVNMNELNGNEKYYYMSSILPTNSIKPSYIENGDIMLYGNNCLVLFYKSFQTSYSYTPLGKIDNIEGFAEALGKTNVQVTFRKG